MKGNLFDLKEALVSEIRPHFKQGDYAITLTFAPFDKQYKSGYKHDLISASSAVTHYLNKVNRMLIGWRPQKPERRLKYAGVFELNELNGLHVHMILEKPSVFMNIEELKVPEHLIKAWVGLREGGKALAQKVEIVTDVDGWLAYMHKGIRESQLGMVDVTNAKY